MLVVSTKNFDFIRYI